MPRTITLKDLRVGDHIGRSLLTTNEIAIHHGLITKIDVPTLDGVEVIDFHLEIDRYTLRSFMDPTRTLSRGGETPMDQSKKMCKTLYRYNYPNSQTRSVAKTVKLANYLYYTKEWDDYHLIDNNCEHFALFCKLKRYHPRTVKSNQLLSLTSHYLSRSNSVANPEAFFKHYAQKLNSYDIIHFLKKVWSKNHPLPHREGDAKHHMSIPSKYHQYLTAKHYQQTLPANIPSKYWRNHYR